MLLKDIKPERVHTALSDSLIAAACSIIQPRGGIDGMNVLQKYGVKDAQLRTALACSSSRVKVCRLYEQNPEKGIALLKLLDENTDDVQEALTAKCGTVLLLHKESLTELERLVQQLPRTNGNKGKASDLVENVGK